MKKTMKKIAFYLERVVKRSLSLDVAWKFTFVGWVKIITIAFNKDNGVILKYFVILIGL